MNEDTSPTPMSRPAAPRRRSWPLCVVLVVALAPALGAAEAVGRFQWKREGAESGCEVVTSTVAGKKYIASKATCTLNARLHAIREILRDIPHYPTWMHDCAATTTLRVVDKANDVSVFWYRQHISILADRDIVLRSAVSHGNVDGKEWHSIVAASTNEVTCDTGKGYVRMPSFTSEWRLEEIDPEHTRVSFMIDPDLGEGLPLGLSNSLIAQMPFRSIRGLTRVLQQQNQLLSSAKP